ncbi:hypothetical protein GGH99_003379 [Coemansia sp. RSA 1285]|nr:hypothetical protein GGH99_003379 [Coemansia sp. RSA 1285]
MNRAQALPLEEKWRLVCAHNQAVGVGAGVSANIAVGTLDARNAAPDALEIMAVDAVLTHRAGKRSVERKWTPVVLGKLQRGHAGAVCQRKRRDSNECGGCGV